jgi:hypothetical protein
MLADQANRARLCALCAFFLDETDFGRFDEAALIPRQKLCHPTVAFRPNSLLPPTLAGWLDPGSTSYSDIQNFRPDQLTHPPQQTKWRPKQPSSSPITIDSSPKIMRLWTDTN